MRLDFNVLWLDDQVSTIQSSGERLQRKLRQEGFELKIISVRSVEEARTHIRDSVFADHIDLVLIDYDLGGGDHGDEALREIRSRVSYKEIIFYSALSTGDLRRLAFEQNVEGVYCTTRSELVDTAFGIFEALTKKVLDLDHTRGIVMGATCDIDQLVHETLMALHEAMPESDKVALLNQVSTKIAEKLTSMRGRADGARTIEQALEEFDLVTAYDRMRIIMDLLKKDPNDDIKEIRKKMGQYLNNVVPKRNLLGHVKIVVDNDGKRLLRSRDGTKELTEADLRELRKELLEHRENFVRLSGVFKPRG